MPYDLKKPSSGAGRTASRDLPGPGKPWWGFVVKLPRKIKVMFNK